MIIQQAILADSVTDWRDYEFTVVEVEGEGSLARGVDSGESSSEKVLQTETTEDGVTTLTTLMPYKVDEDGKMINSFEYAERVVGSRSANNYVDNFADVVVATSVEYEIVGTYYYRHGGVTTYWSCPSGTVSSINSLCVEYGTRGMLYYWNNGRGEAIGNQATAVLSEINISNPTKGKMYQAYDWTESDRVFGFGGDDLGSTVNISVNNVAPMVYRLK